MLTEDERTAAYLVYLFAALHYPGSDADMDWFVYTTDLSFKNKGLESAVLWSMRMEDEDPDPDWIGYCEYVVSYRKGRGGE